MNIMLMVTQLNKSNGGVCTHIVDLCKGFIAQGHKVIVLSSEGDYTQNVIDTGAKFYEVNFYYGKNVQEIGKLILYIKKIIKKEKINIMHLHGQRIVPIAWCLRLITHIPFLWTNHIDAIASPDVFKKFLKYFRFPIISVSSDLKEYLIKDFGVLPDRIKVICNGTDSSEYFPLSDEEKTHLKAEYEIKEGDYVIALLARVCAVKGQDMLLSAVHEMRKSNPNIHIKVLLAGKVYEDWKNWFDQLMLFAQQNGIDVKYLGFQNPRNVFGIADISVLPSQYEGFPLTCLESLLMETPVIRSNTPGWSDLQDVCLVFDKGNKQEFVNKIMYALEHREELRTMGCVGRQKVLKQFTKEIMCQSTIEYYQEIIDKKVI